MWSYIYAKSKNLTWDKQNGSQTLLKYTANILIILSMKVKLKTSWEFFLLLVSRHAKLTPLVYCKLQLNVYIIDLAKGHNSPRH